MFYLEKCWSVLFRRDDHKFRKTKRPNRVKKKENFFYTKKGNIYAKEQIEQT